MICLICMAIKPGAVGPRAEGIHNKLIMIADVTTNAAYHKILAE